MDIRSLGLYTDLMFHRFEGAVTDHGDLLVIRTPSNPTFRWGNFLLFPSPPGPGDFERWERLFVRHVGDLEHRVFAWDVDAHRPTEPHEGAIDPFLTAGFRRERSEVLSVERDGLSRDAPPAPDGLVVRALEGDEWRGAIDLQVLCEDREDPAGYRIFRERKMDAYRRMRGAGLGDWYGGFLDGRLVADMGIFVEGGVGRFQSVETHPDYRRRGVAGAMVHALSRRAFEAMGARVVVIQADPGGPAVALYKRLGYQLGEVLTGIEKYPL